ncbi:hypothetical protein A4A49_04389 [Nicotiana attenuata]|uniref:Uncharacterized protein n=1 Tax=Nicotiana attenuata TaxID=49451 RepID=A0A314L402_NICAT|nr:hypothetical protein A4A49_04389 [Nicotiana attenuata]
MLQGTGASFMLGLAVGSIPMMSMAVFGDGNCFQKTRRPPPTGGMVNGLDETNVAGGRRESASSRVGGRRMGLRGNVENGGRGKTYPSVQLVKEVLPAIVLR